MTSAFSNAQLPNVSIKMEYELEGKDVVFEGTARFVNMDTEVSYDDVRSIYDRSVSRLYQDAHTTKLTADLLDGWKITVKEKEVTPVHHTARVLATDRTVEAFEAARKRAGAPKGAKMRMQPDYSRREGELILVNLDEPLPISVEFEWKEEVK